VSIVAEPQPFIPRPIDEDAALRSILEGTATETGEAFFRALVQNLAAVLDTYAAWVTEYIPEKARLRALAFRLSDGWIEDYEIDIAGTPCERVVTEGKLLLHPSDVVTLYARDDELKRLGIVSYMGVPLKDVDGNVLGHLAVMDTRPMAEDPKAIAVFRIFANRAAAELRRMRTENELREREEKLARLIDSAMDAIVEVDQGLSITRGNPAALRLFGSSAVTIAGNDFGRFLTDGSREKLIKLVGNLTCRPDGEQFLWIPGGLTIRKTDDTELPAEATLSSYEVNRQVYYTLILRDVKERLEAEKKINTLTAEAEYLRQELRSLENYDSIVGESKPMLELMGSMTRVAGLDTTVLIYGETGTGKELVARAIHAHSKRSKKPLVRVNCAAIPANLMESEFFGHDKGAFTGATEKREGRFALADGGTIFLDEIGELPIDLQSKLLRVIQEGEFEPVGSSKTQKTDVRIIAATNRDLKDEVAKGTFREDLYYRLNVYPINVPPLRNRGSDVVLMARVFVESLARKAGLPVPQLSANDEARLKAYRWPGNVRELQNVIERALIASPPGDFNLDQALPVFNEARAVVNEPQPTAADSRILTEGEVRAFERDNITRALEACDWKVAGKNGAAERLGMHPSTLSSRMKALGIARPSGSRS